ncbi:MAG: hypothetical protein GXO15_00005, partial [Crenarchaeota archaeon]|nr:hypothetical protein [Thermoproteota archaeon]
LAREPVTPLARALLGSRHLRRLLGLRVAELGVSRRFAYAVLETGHVGVAYAWQGEPIPRRLLEEETLEGLLVYAWQHPAATQASLAAASAALSLLLSEEPGLVEWEPGWRLLDAMGIGEGSRVAVVGLVGGLVEELRRRRATVVVYEDDPLHRREAERLGVEARPGGQLALEAAGYSHIVATGASLLTPEAWSAVRGSEAVKGLVGPTASLPLDAAMELGYTAVAGSVVPPEQSGAALRLARAGYGFRVLRRHMRKWLWARG